MGTAGHCQTAHAGLLQRAGVLAAGGGRLVEEYIREILNAALLVILCLCLAILAIRTRNALMAQLSEFIAREFSPLALLPLAERGPVSIADGAATVSAAALLERVR